MAHDHCDRCFFSNCFHAYACAMVYCANGCSAHMHECKRDDHEFVCPNVNVPCLNASYGCPCIIRRSQLGRHLRVCPASVTVCPFLYARHRLPNHHVPSTDKEGNTCKKEEDNPEPLLSVFTSDNVCTISQMMALRDSLWNQHVTEFNAHKRRSSSELNSSLSKNNKVDRSIRSEKYSYITIPECVLSKQDGIVCSTCRRHVRQLEENEDERLSNLSEGE
jgi:hypothetical protein